MTDLFIKAINISLSASLLVLAIIIFRLIFKNVPKYINCLLWIIVAIRLVCPFLLESAFSLIPNNISNGNVLNSWTDDYVGNVKIIEDQSEDYIKAVDAGRKPILSDEGHSYVVVKDKNLGEPDTVATKVIPTLSFVWIIGLILMLGYSIYSYLKLKHNISTSVILKDNIYQSDKIQSPFVFGFLNPRIYIPFKLKSEDEKYVIAHEQAHISRCDHLVKPIGYLLLTIYWFNPMIWIAYILLCKDIELACDEKVVSNFNKEQKADYSQALLSCSVSNKMAVACPVAFGEVGVKERVKNILNYKKPTFWIVLVATIFAVLISVSFLTNPIKSSVNNVFNEKGYTIVTQSEKNITISIPKSAITENAYTEKGITFAENQVVVYKTDTTSFWIEKIHLSNDSDKLEFIFNSSYNLSDESVILLSCWKDVYGDVNYVKVADNDPNYDDNIINSSENMQYSQQFKIFVKTDLCKQIDNELNIDLVCTETRYKKSSMMYNSKNPYIKNIKYDEENNVAKYEIDGKNKIKGAIVSIEQWSNGVCLDRAKKIVNGDITTIDIYSEINTDEEGIWNGSGFNINIGNETLDNISADFDFPNNQEYIGMWFNSYGEKFLNKKLDIVCNKEYVLALQIFDSEFKVTYTGEIFSKYPDIMKEPQNMVVLKVEFCDYEPKEQLLELNENSAKQFVDETLSSFAIGSDGTLF